ncbi:MAG: amino acid adenylation domain-containing protein, partial [Bacteroidales bacterium]
MNQTSYFPLSVSQLGIYYECAKDKSLTTYNRPFVVKMSLDTDTIRLCTAIRTVFKAHPTLNTEIEIINEEPSQSYDAGKPVEIGELVVSESDIDELKRNYARPFEIIGSRLYRIDIYRTEKNVYLFYDIHHIIIDGTSLSVFVSDIASAYDGADLEEETYTVGQYALDEALHAGDEKYRQNESFFASVMDGAEMVSLASPKNESGIGYMRRHSVTMPLKCVDDFCATNRVTPNIFFASGLGICLWRFAREEKIGFCTVHNGRLDTRIVRNTGMFVKTLPVILDVKPEMKIADFMVSVRQYLKVLWTKQNYPFAEIVKNFGANMEIAYTFQNKMAEHFTIGGIRVEIERLYRGLCADKLEIYIIAQDNDYEIRFEYNDALFDDDYIRSFASSMQAVLRQMLVSAESKCREIQLLSADDEEYILGFSHGKRLLVDNSKTVISLFREQVAKTPDKRALIYKEKKFTYAELDEITDRMAFALSACGVRPETVVGIITERSENIVILPLAVMKAGGAYIPLDPTMPPERLLFMLNDAGVNVVISDGDMAERIIPSYKGRVFCSDVLAGMDVPSGTELYPPSPENMFVILYTSGSTGTPKGCVLEHRTLVNFCRAHSEENTITSADSTIAYANFAFDAHIMEIYPFLLSGSEVHVISSVDKMNLVWVNDYIERNNITIVFFTTQIGKQFIEDFDNRSLRTMLLGGERLTAVKKPRFVFYNLYGPTECTVYATRYKVEKDYDGNVIGSPLYNYNIYVTDNMMKLLPIGISGELCIGGGVGRGYLNRKELTAAKFVDFCGERVYRTGDLVRWNSNGEIEFLGRMDGQVKLRGLRIELGEIENRMMMFPDITAAVTDVKDIAGVQHLCGYFTAKSRIEIASLRDFMSETLTEFMIPTGIMQLDNFPLTSNGKINRRVLPAPEVTQDEIVLPATNTEREILEIVAELIKNHDFGVTTNLFSIGITSILAIKLSTLISTRLSLDIPTKTILKLKTIRTFAVEGKESIRGIAKTYEKQRLNPLTETQKGIYYDWAKVPEALQYNIPMILRLPSITDVKRLRKAVMDVIDAHPYIKSGMQMSDDEPKLLRRDDDNPEVLLYDAKDGDIERLEKEFVRPFDLFSDSLYRVEIYKTPEAVYLLSDFHHIIYDGTSMGIFYSDLSRAYNGEQLLKESYTAFDVAYYEDEQSREEPYLKAVGYFAKKLQGVTMTQLPAAASPTGGDKAQSVICHIPQGEILNFCMDAGVTENSFFLAVLCQILNRYTR